jgi:5-methylcytosine-specific restriction protein A
LTHGVGIDEFIPDEEGRMTYRQHAVYERSHRNRARAIQIHGEKCLACGFCFNSVYGVEHAGSYIEIHHVRSITEQEGLEVDPGTDLVPLCSNCHSMAHRKTGIILSVTELKELLNRGGGSAS